MSDGSQTGVPAPRKRRRWAFLLAVVAFAPFALVFVSSGNRSGETLILSDADQESLTDGLRMLSPRFTGRTEQDEPFIVSAEWALPNGPNPSRVGLSGVRASILMKDGRKANLTAANGVYFPNDERLRLENGVVAETSDGYRVETAAATVDGKAGRLITDGAVEAEGPGGSIRSDVFEALDADDRIVMFRGSVRATFRPAEAEGFRITTPTEE